MDAALASLANGTSKGKGSDAVRSLDRRLGVKAAMMDDETAFVFVSAQNGRNATLQASALRCKYGVLEAGGDFDSLHAADASGTAANGDCGKPLIGPTLPPGFAAASQSPASVPISPSVSDHSVSDADATTRRGGGGGVLWQCDGPLIGWPDDGVPKPTVYIDDQLPIYVVWPDSWETSARINRVKHDRSGFMNFGNTCFLNSVLQVLGHTLPFVIYSTQHVHCDVAKRFNSCMLCQFNALLMHAGSRYHGEQQPPQPAVAPRCISKRLRAIMPTYQQGRQEDAHEFLRCLLNAMEQDRLRPYRGRKLDPFSNETNIIGRIFGGFWLNTMVCLSCNYQSKCFDPFWDIAVDVKRSTDLKEALDTLTKKEHLAGANAWKCQRCGVAVRATKRLTIHRPPPVLTVHLKRYDSVTLNKLNKLYKYPERIDLSSYITPNSRWTSSGTKVLYQLYAVINHHGNNTHSGHYNAYVRSIKPAERDGGSQWLLCDDSKVTLCDNATHNAHNMHTAYMLFYMRVLLPVARVQPSLGHSPVAAASASGQSPLAAKSITGATGRPVFAPAAMGQGVVQRSPALAKVHSPLVSPAQKVTHRVQPLPKVGHVPLVVSRAASQQSSHATHNGGAAASKAAASSSSASSSSQCAKRKLVPYASDDDDDSGCGESGNTNTTTSASSRPESEATAAACGSSASLYSGLPPPAHSVDASHSGDNGAPAPSNGQVPAKKKAKFHAGAGAQSADGLSPRPSLKMKIRRPSIDGVRHKEKRKSASSTDVSSTTGEGDVDTSTASSAIGQTDAVAAVKKRKKNKNKQKIDGGAAAALKSENEPTAAVKCGESPGRSGKLKSERTDGDTVHNASRSLPAIAASYDDGDTEPANGQLDTGAICEVAPATAEEPLQCDKVAFVKRHHVRERKAHLRTSAEEEETQSDRSSAGSHSRRKRSVADSARRSGPDESAGGTGREVTVGDTTYIVTPFEPPKDPTVRWGEDRMATWSGQSSSSRRSRSHSPASDGRGGRRSSDSDGGDSRRQRRPHDKQHAGGARLASHDGAQAHCKKANMFQKVQDERNAGHEQRRRHHSHQQQHCEQEEQRRSHGSQHSRHSRHHREGHGRSHCHRRHYDRH